MEQNQIATFASKLTTFRGTLDTNERIMLDRMVTAKDGGDDVSAHQLTQQIQFALDGSSYRIIAMRTGDDNDVSAHRLSF